MWELFDRLGFGEFPTVFAKICSFDGRHDHEKRYHGEPDKWFVNYLHVDYEVNDAEPHDPLASGKIIMKELNENDIMIQADLIGALPRDMDLYMLLTIETYYLYDMEINDKVTVACDGHMIELIKNIVDLSNARIAR